MQRLLVLFLGGIILIVVFAFGVIDMFGRVDYLKEHFPWFTRVLERRGALGVVGVVGILLLIGNIYELMSYDIPNVEAPRITISAPRAPIVENPKTITRILPASEPAKKCWVSNHFGFPNSKIAGAVSATTVIIHCNHKVDPPWVLVVQFDRDFIPGGVVLNDSGMWMMGGVRRQGNTYSVQINSPALLSDQIVTLTVYGRTDQYPRAVAGDIKALN